MIEALKHVAIFIANGFLLLVYETMENMPAVLTAGGMGWLAFSAPPAQKPWIGGMGALALVAVVLSHVPVPAILLLMVLAGVVSVETEQFDRDGLRWTIAGGVALYALAALGYDLYAWYLKGQEAMAWAQAIGGQGEAAGVLARGKGVVDTLALWGLWLIMPLGYFALLIKGRLAHPPSPSRPEDLITTVRTRGKRR